MARFAKQLSVGNDNTQHLSVGVLALVFPVAQVQRILVECGRASQRVRDLPAAVVFFYVVGLSLFPATGYESVLRWLLAGLQWLESGTFRVSSKAALSAARQRLGAEPLRSVHAQMARPLADPNLAGSYWKGLHLVAIDGSTLALQDTPSNAEAFGRSANQNGQGAYPLARFVALVEVGTHLIFGARLGKYADSELKLTEGLIEHLKPGMLCLADRLFPGYELWQRAAATGAHLLWRAKVGLQLECFKKLSDGSWLAYWHPSRKVGKGNSALVVRVIEYKLRKTAKGQQDKEGSEGEVYRLITTLLDVEVASATELAATYPQRWEIELTVKESKSVLRHGRITLRSKVAELVHQEFWGLVLGHYVVRKMMAQAALDNKTDPDGLSYQASVEIIKSTQAGSALSFSP